MQQREKSQGNQNVVKNGQDGGSPVNPLESEGNIYQHARQSIEGNENRLAAQLGPHFGPYDFDVADGKAAEGVATLQCGEHRRGYAVDRGKFVEIRQDAAFPIVPIREDPSGELLIAVASIGG